MTQNNAAIAKAYYTLMADKNSDAMGKFLHDDVVFIGPLSQTKGKEAVLEATQKVMGFFQSLTIRSALGSDDQAVVIYDLGLSAPMGKFRAAALLTFQDDLIAEIELFYDPKPFEMKFNDPFSKK